MSKHVILNADDIVIAVSDTGNGLVPGYGEYVAEISDRQQAVVGEPVGPAPQCDGQTTLI